MRAYIAAGWFTDEQEAARLEVLRALKVAKIPAYSPKDDLLFVPGNDPYDVFNANVYEIRSCDFMVASTEGKDMGTLFECGYAYGAGIPIIYYYTGTGPFNLMLSCSAFCVASNYSDLVKILKSIDTEGSIFKRKHDILYKGELE